MIHHPTIRCYILKDKIQFLVDAGVLTLKSEQKKVSANMISLKFGEIPEVRVQDGLSPISKGEMKVISITGDQKDKGLVPMTTQSGEVMWVHPDILNDEQWIKANAKGKGKSCNVISISKVNDIVLITALTDFEEEHIVLAAQPAAA